MAVEGKKARCEETVEAARAAEGQDDAASGAGAVRSTSSAVSKAAPVTSKDTPPPSGVGPQAGVSTTPTPAPGGAAERVISIPSDEKGETGNGKEPGDSVGPSYEATGKEDPPSWEGHSAGEMGESEADDDVSIHEALSSEEEALSPEDLLALHAEQQWKTAIVDLASDEVRAAVEDRDRRLNETMSLEIRLSAELEQAKAEDARVAYEQQTADNRLSRLSSEIEELKQVIANAQASLVIQEKAREQAAKELEDIESRRQLVADSVEEKYRALKEVKDAVQDLVSRTEEDLLREVLRRLKLRLAGEIREAELRLKAL
ncbi:uncharacterized protein LOC109821076 [Asparagus officinalis]|uniref:uncharacterized protein LOC109821076 n=1 Tax=Asparagus officinalis TaxID=4686 RepID=UPI00098E192E|nr:uncharacterized protein LOC109821076 [Asparagus officinalis]